MGKLTDIVIAAAGLYEILTYREDQPAVIDRALEKCARLYSAGVGLYRVFVPLSEESVKPYADCSYRAVSVRPSAEDYRKKIDDLTERINERRTF